MDAPRKLTRGSRRAACLIAGLLCALGILAGSALRGADATHHRSPMIATAAQIADSHSTSLRGDQHLTVATPAATVHSLIRTRSTTSLTASLTSITIDVVRTRGPPALA